MAKAISKKAAPTKRAPRKKPIAQQAAEEVLQEVAQQTAKPSFFSALLKRFTSISLPYKIGGAALLVIVFVLIFRGCNSPQHIVTANDKQTAPAEQEVERLKQERSALQAKAISDSIALVDAVTYANLQHEENQRISRQLDQMNAEKDAYLKQKKSQSDANKQIIKSGTSQQLDSLWARIKIANGKN